MNDEGAQGRETGADDSDGEFDDRPDCDGDVVPRGVDGGTEDEEGLEADYGDDAATTQYVLHQ